MTNNLVDEQQNKELRGIAQRMRELNYQWNEGALNRKEEIAIEGKLEQEQVIFVDKCFEYFRVPAFRKAQKEQRGWGSPASLEVAFNSVFNDLIFVELMKKIMKVETDLDNFRFGAFVVSRIGLRMVDAYRNLSKKRTSNDFSEEDTSLSFEDQLILREKVEELTKIYYSIIPNKKDRVLLNLLNDKHNSHKAVAKIFGFENKDSIKVRKARLMKKIISKIPKDLFIILLEVSFINEQIDKNRLIPEVINPFTSAQLAAMISSESIELGEKIFDKDLVPWILLRWRTLLNPKNMEQAHVYEFSELTELINYQRSTMNQLIDFLKKYKIIQIK